MAVLSDANLKKYKTSLDKLKTEVNNWDKYLTDAETLINKSTGNTFKAEYAQGKKAVENIQGIIDVLQKLKKDLKKLLTAANDFYTTSAKAAKSKTASKSSTKK